MWWQVLYHFRIGRRESWGSAITVQCPRYQCDLTVIAVFYAVYFSNGRQQKPHFNVTVLHSALEFEPFPRIFTKRKLHLPLCSELQIQTRWRHCQGSVWNFAFRASNPNTLKALSRACLERKIFQKLYMKAALANETWPWVLNPCSAPGSMAPRSEPQILALSSEPRSVAPRYWPHQRHLGCPNVHGQARRSQDLWRRDVLPRSHES